MDIKFSPILLICRKELNLFFSSPMAYLFMAVFSALNLFIFFWIESYFARNISDMKPLFEWMPIVLIFLCSALTMRSWSEEIRQGTIEHILTQPIGLMPFVLGKFLACLVMLVIALLISLPLALTVNYTGDLDWGPVAGGYLASILLGSAYISLGLFASARNENQIVALIGSVSMGGLLYLIGSDAITNLFTTQAADWLRALGSGSRFDAITRGVIDFGDLYYYLSLTGAGLALNHFSLQRTRWQNNRRQPQKAYLGMLLVVANLLLANVWLNQLTAWRFDTTQGQIYSISEASKRQLAELQEPLLIRGYFSDKTHPLLAPLVPQLTDLLKEFEIAGNGRIQLQIIDPSTNPEAEDEANGKYGIRPTPFQIQSRHQASVINSYFNILLQYGDEFETLNFQDLIDVRQAAENDVQVLLRNPEYDLTNSIRKITQAYRSGGDIFSGLNKPLQLTNYISAPDTLPQSLRPFLEIVEEVSQELQQRSNNQLQVSFIDPQKNAQAAQQLADDFGLKPMLASLVDTKQFYFYLILQQDDRAIQIPLNDLRQESLLQSLESAIKRFSQGFSKTVGIVSAQGPANQFGQVRSLYTQVEGLLQSDYNLNRVDLESGSVAVDNDVLVLLGLDDLSDQALFAIDQYLMRGGTMIAATSAFASDLSRRNLDIRAQTGSFIEWLEHHGMALQKTLIMDEQSAPFPIPVTRQVGDFSFEEIRLIQYPYFADVRGPGLNNNSAITANLKRAIFAWASPIQLTTTQLSVDYLAKTSERAWGSTSLDVLPQINPDGSTAFKMPAERQLFDVGVSLSGPFVSYFKDRPAPTIQQTTATQQFNSPIEKAAESARIVLFSSSDFLKDQVMNILGSANRSAFTDNLQLMANAVESSLDHSGLQSIRSRGNFNRTLIPMQTEQQQFIEYLNYALVIFQLLLIGLLQKLWQQLRIKRLIGQLQASS